LEKGKGSGAGEEFVKSGARRNKGNAADGKKGVLKWKERKKAKANIPT